jgi:transcriptional regulator with XRE-family HTH domain
MLGERLRTVLKEKGIRPTALARELNISLPRISNYINGKREPDFGMLIRISEVLDVDLNYFAGYDRFLIQPSLSRSVVYLHLEPVGKKGRNSDKEAYLPICKDMLWGITNPDDNAVVFDVYSSVPDDHFGEGSRVVAAKFGSFPLKDNAIILQPGEKMRSFLYTRHNDNEYLVSLRKEGVSIEKKISSKKELQGSYIAVWVMRKQ